MIFAPGIEDSFDETGTSDDWTGALSPWDSGIGFAFEWRVDSIPEGCKTQNSSVFAMCVTEVGMIDPDNHGFEAVYGSPGWTGTGGTAYAGVCLRADPFVFGEAPGDGSAVIGVWYAGDALFRIGKVEGGVRTFWASGSNVMNDVEGTVIRLVVENGNEYSLYVDGVLEVSYTDTSDFQAGVTAGGLFQRHPPAQEFFFTSLTTIEPVIASTMPVDVFLPDAVGPTQGDATAIVVSTVMPAAIGPTQGAATAIVVSTFLPVMSGGGSVAAFIDPGEIEVTGGIFAVVPETEWGADPIPSDPYTRVPVVLEPPQTPAPEPPTGTYRPDAPGPYRRG